MQNWILQRKWPKVKVLANALTNWWCEQLSSPLVSTQRACILLRSLRKRVYWPALHRRYAIEWTKIKRQKMRQTGSFVNEIMFSKKKCTDFNTLWRRYVCAEVYICWTICANKPRRHKCFNFCLRSVFVFRHIKSKITIYGNVKRLSMGHRRIGINLITSHVLHPRHQPVREGKWVKVSSTTQHWFQHTSCTRARDNAWDKV